MRGFARRDADGLRCSPRRFERTLRARYHRPLSEQHHEIAAQAVRQHQIGLGHEHRLQPVAGIFAEAQIGRHRIVQQGCRPRPRGGHRIAVRIADQHRSSACLAS
jgi:hypothetical protein